jgi:type VI secretion system protein ImpJ
VRQLLSVVWSKGVFLSPQHLQAQDHFFEDLLRFTLEAASAAYWGFSSLQIDASSVTEGRLQLSSASGLFPDGLAFDTTESDEAPQSRLLQECLQGGRESCIFYLAIPQRRPGGVNIAPQGGGLSTRFYSKMLMLRDENSSGVEKPVSLARKNMQIIAEGESLEGFVPLPMARIRMTEAGRFVLDREFVAPMINVRASELLMGILRGLVEVLVSRSGQLAGARRQRNQSLADFSASDIASFWLLYTINTHLPLFHQWMEAAQVHPERMYSEMLALGGALTTFSRNIAPSDFPRYDHEGLGSCFLEMERKILELLNTVIPSRFIALPLRQVRDSVYVTEVERDEYLANSRVYLAIQAELSAAELIQRAPGLIKACSATHLETLIRQALPGISLTHVAAPPQEIPVKLHYQYFSLERAGAAWESVTRARNFGVYVPEEIANPSMQLILISTDAEQ